MSLRNAKRKARRGRRKKKSGKGSFQTDLEEIDRMFRTPAGYDVTGPIIQHGEIAGFHEFMEFSAEKTSILAFVRRRMERPNERRDTGEVMQRCIEATNGSEDVLRAACNLVVARRGFAPAIRYVHRKRLELVEAFISAVSPHREAIAARIASNETKRHEMVREHRRLWRRTRRQRRRIQKEMDAKPDSPPGGTPETRRPRPKPRAPDTFDGLVEDSGIRSGRRNSPLADEFAPGSSLFRDTHYSPFRRRDQLKGGITT